MTRFWRSSNSPITNNMMPECLIWLQNTLFVSKSISGSAALLHFSWIIQIKSLYPIKLYLQLNTCKQENWFIQYHINHQLFQYLTQFLLNPESWSELVMGPFLNIHNTGLLSSVSHTTQALVLNTIKGIP